MAEKRLRSSGGRLRGWVSRSYLLPRRDDDGSVECLESLGCREDDLVESRAASRGSLREDFFDERDDEDLVGDEGCELLVRWAVSRLSMLGLGACFFEEVEVEDGAFLLAPKNFIGGVAAYWASRLEKIKASRNKVLPDTQPVASQTGAGSGTYFVFWGQPVPVGFWLGLESNRAEESYLEDSA